MLQNFKNYFVPTLPTTTTIYFVFDEAQPAHVQEQEATFSHVSKNITMESV